MGDRSWEYAFDLPAGDFQTNRALVKPGYLPDLTGVDGRFSGGLRRFPGFRQMPGISVGGTEAYPAYFAKYVELQGGASSSILRGFVIANSTGVYFNFYSTSGAAYYATQLTEVGTYTVQDVAYRGKFLYILCGSSGCFTYSTTGAAYPSHLRYYPFGYGSSPTIDSATVGSSGGSTSDYGLVTETVTYYDDGDSSWAYTARAAVLIGVRMGHLQRNTWTPLVTRVVSVYDTNNGYTTEGSISPEYRFTITGQLTLPTNTEYNCLEIYRTIPNGGTLFLAKRVYTAETTYINNDGGTGHRTFTLGDDPGSTDYEDASTDDVLAYAGKVYDIDTEDPGTTRPKLDRGIMMSHVFLGRPDITAFSEEAAEVWWSMTDRVAAEIFPAENVYRPSTLSDRIIGFVRAGSYAIGLASSKVYRFGLSGSLVAVYELADGYGCVGRYAACAVGTEVFYICDSGLVSLNVETGTLTTIGVLDRILQTTWASSLANVSMAFDTRMGALFILNPTLEETMVLWASTNTVCRLEGTRFTQVIQGCPANTGGAKQACFIHKAGLIFLPNHDRSFSQTMLSLTGDTGTTYIHNGTVASASTGTTMTPDSFSSFSVSTNWKHYIYFLSGAMAGKRRLINNNGSGGWTLTADPLESGGVAAATLAAGDRFAISPVVMQVTGWPLGSSDEADSPRLLSNRRTLVSMMVNLVLEGGEDDPATNDNLTLTVQGFKRTQNTPLGTQDIDIDEAPTSCKGAVGISDFVVRPGVKFTCSNVDLTLVGFTAHGNFAQGGDVR